MICHVAGGIQGLDLDVLFAVTGAVLAEQQPGQGIIDRCLAGGVVAVNGTVLTAELQNQMPMALKIFQYQPHNFDVSHCLFSLSVVKYHRH